MKKCLLLLIISVSILGESNAQFTRYIVKLKNKGGTPYTFANPQAYLSQRSIDRRTRYGIAIDSTDLPVTPSYVTQIKNVANVTLLNVSKWLNAVTIQTSDANAITTINGFAFVQSVSGIATKNNGTTAGKFSGEEIVNEITNSSNRINADYYNYGSNAYTEIHLH